MTLLIIKIWCLLSVVSVFLSILRKDWGVIIIEDITVIERNSKNVFKKIMLVLALFLLYAFRLPKTLYIIIKQIFQ
jgi:hypothetical protein